MSLRAGVQLIHQLKKSLPPAQMQTKTWGILEMQLSKKSGLTNEKACLSFPQLNPWLNQKRPLAKAENIIIN